MSSLSALGAIEGMREARRSKLKLNTLDGIREARRSNAVCRLELRSDYGGYSSPTLTNPSLKLK